MRKVGLTETEEDGECSWTNLICSDQLNTTDEAKAIARGNPKY